MTPKSRSERTRFPLLSTEPHRESGLTPVTLNSNNTKLGKIAAVVVLYRPDASVVSNIASYVDQVDAIIAVDNTPDPEASIVATLARFPSLTYVPMGRNAGISAALNRGLSIAQGRGFEWVLTMDQDSTATPDMVSLMVARLLEDRDPTPIAIVAPEHLQVGGAQQVRPEGFVQVLTTMTSGNLLSVEAWCGVGGFMDELFIDQVDNEFCLRLARHGLRVMLASGAVLHHRVGSTKYHPFPLPAFTSNHSPIRRYYITRNRLLVGRLYREDYPQYGRFERRQAAKEALKILLYEDAKFEKFSMIWRGYRDYRHGVLGPYEQRRKNR